MSRVVTHADIRPYTDADERGVLELLNAALGGGPAGARTGEFFRWKHLENPFGRSFMLVASSGGRIVGFRAFMRWEFALAGHRLRAVRAVDTATHPEHQGQGIFSRLTLEALDALQHEADFVFNTPNEKSLPGYLKMGWGEVGRVPIRIRVRRPIRFARGARSWRDTTGSSRPPASNAADAGQFLDDRIETLLREGEQSPGIATRRDSTYLRWRYGSAPLLDYHAAVTGGDGRPEGLAIFRLRHRGALIEATVAETIVRDGGRRAASKLLRSVGSTSGIDHVACSFPPASAPEIAARRLGSVRVPGGMTLVVNPLGHDLDLNPLDMRSWALTVGDLEVF